MDLKAKPSETQHSPCSDHDGDYRQRKRSEGSYLAACTILSTILGKPFESSHYAGLPETTARYLQKTAGEVVRDNLSLIGLKKEQ